MSKKFRLTALYISFFSIVSPYGLPQNFPTKIGDVNLKQPVTFLFMRADVKYLDDGSIFIKTAIVWNTAHGPDGKLANGAIVGEFPPVPRGIPVPDTDKPFVPTFDSRHCRALPDGHARCKNITLHPVAIKAVKR